MPDYSDYTFDLTADQINEIISDLEFLRDGGKICYLIDPADITDYCYPFGLETETPDKRDLLPYTVIGKSKFALSHLFEKAKEREIVVMYSYQDEFFNFQRKMEEHAKVADDVDKFIQDFENQTATIQDIETIISRFIPQISAIISGLEQKGLATFETLLSSKTIILERLLPVGHSTREALRRFRDGEYWKQYKTEIMQLFRLFPELQRKSNRRATLSDCIAILTARTLQKTNQEIRFLYLSTQKKTFNVFKDPSLNRVLGYGDTETKMLRTAGHIFYEMVNRISNDYDGNINQLKRMVKRYGSGSLNEEVALEDRPHLLNDQLLELRSEYENFAMLARADIKKFESAQLRLSKILTGDNTLTRIYLYLKENSDSFREVASTKQSLSLFSMHVINKLTEFFVEPDQRSAWLGKDPIEGKMHILPINFPVDSEFGVVAKHLKSLIKIFIGEETWHSKKADIEKIVMEGVKSDREDHHFKLLLFTVLLVIRNEDDQELLDELKLLILDSEVLMDDGRKSHHLTPELLVELKYVACWAARRARGYDLSLSICKDVLEKDSDDPRFWHGKFLAEYSLWHDKKEKGPIGFNEAYDELDSAKVSCEKAYVLFEARQHEFTEVNRTLEVLDNSLAYLYLALAKLIKAETTDSSWIALIYQSRASLMKLKTREKNWSSFPEYFHTEVELEIEEVKELMHAQRYDEAREKYNYAKNTLAHTKSLINGTDRTTLMADCDKLDIALQELHGILK